MNVGGDELPAGAELCGGAYTIDKYLNSGGFGITYLARDSLGRRVVIKECFPSAMCYRHGSEVRQGSRSGDGEFAAILELFEKEARALSELSHPYIVGVHQIFHDNNTAYMALDFVEGKDLLQVIEDEPDRLGPDELHQLLLQCLEAVDYIHARDILHRDISPDNILLDDQGLPVLIDFGAARESATRLSRVLSKVLTVKDGYSPQEFYMQGSKQEYSSDLYALAATFYHLVSGAAPPSSHIRMSAVARNAPDPFVPLDGSNAQGYAQHFLDAINTCLSIFPGERLQSAVEWRDVIDVERRRQILLELAEEDRELEERVHRLVAEYRQSLRAEQAAAKAKTQDAATPPKAPERPKRRKLSPILLEEPLEQAEAEAEAEAETVAEAGAGGTAEAGAMREPESAPAPQAPTAAAPPPLPPEPKPVSKPRGLKGLVAGTKKMILGQGKARYE